MRFYRMEAADGRGPFRPGWSHTWRDASGHEMAPPWEEAGISISDFQRLIPAGQTACCGCRSITDLRAWFSRAERRRLKRLGYREVEVPAEKVVLETPTQVVFVRGRRLVFERAV